MTGRATGTAQGIRHEGVGEAHPALGDAIHVRCPQNPVPGAAHGVIALVVGHHEQDVGTAILRLEQGGKPGRAGQEVAAEHASHYPVQ